MRTVLAGFDAAVVAAIDSRLDVVVASGVAVPLAMDVGTLPRLHVPTLVAQSDLPPALAAQTTEC